MDKPNKRKWIQQHKFEAHLAAFSLMVLPALALYYAGLAGDEALIWALIGAFAAANVIALLAR